MKLNIKYVPFFRIDILKCGFAYLENLHSRPSWLVIIERIVTVCVLPYTSWEVLQLFAEKPVPMVGETV